MTTRQEELLKAAKYFRIYNSVDQTPCFHVEGERFCIHSFLWDGHDGVHPFVSLEDLLRSVIEERDNQWTASVFHLAEEIRLRALTQALRDALSTFEGAEHVVTEERIETWKEILRANGEGLES